MSTSTKRTFWHSLIWTTEGHLDLSWLLTLLCTLAGVLVFIIEAATGKRASIAAWSWLGATFAATLIAAVPVAKARLLASSKMLGNVAHGIASAREEGMSTDIQEISDNGTKQLPII